MRDSSSVVVRLVYLARLREALGSAGEPLALPPAAPATVASVLDALRARGGAFAAELAPGRAVRVAVNHAMARPDDVGPRRRRGRAAAPGHRRLIAMEVRVQERISTSARRSPRCARATRAWVRWRRFVGTVRDVNDGAGVASMTLEHYPGMTEKALQAIVDEAKRRFDVYGLRVIHRVGELRPTDQIVLVAVTSAHRGEAFDACRFVMDYLKTRAPFWKKEHTAQGARWVEARASDDEAAQRWER